MTDRFRFTDNRLTVRILETCKDHLQAFQLRHAIYCSSLAWVKGRPDGLECDAYEEGSTSIGVFTEDNTLVGVVRLIPSERPFMLEQEFLPLVGPDHSIKKQADTVEVTRLATRRTPRSQGPSLPISCLLYKGIYHWSCDHGVRYLYLVVETAYLRTLRRWGFPCSALGPAQILDRGAPCVAALLDWEAFRAQALMRPKPFTSWLMDNRQTRRAPPPALSPEPGYGPSTCA